MSGGDIARHMDNLEGVASQTSPKKPETSL